MKDLLLSPEALVYLAGGCYILGMLIINQVALRLMVLTGTCFYMLYYATVAEDPLWEALYISVMIGLANIIGLAGLLAGRSRWAIPRAHSDIYAHFPSISPGDFRTLMRHAKRFVVDQEMILTEEDTPVTRLFYVVSGRTEVVKKGDRFEVPSGVFVGEVAYLTGHRASATTTLLPGSEVLEWLSLDLHATSARSSRFKLALESVLSLDLAQKVAMSVAPLTPIWRPDMGLQVPVDPAPAQAESSFSNP